MLTEFTRWGITSVLGLLGADGITRDLMGLLAKLPGARPEDLWI